MYKEDLVLNNLQGLICHKTQPNQTKPKIWYYFLNNVVTQDFFFY